MSDLSESAAKEMPRHVHLDIMGGIAGDMFIAALWDARPDLTAGTIAAIRATGVPADWVVEPETARDTGLVGTRMRIGPPGGQRPTGGHYEFAAIERSIHDSALQVPVRTRALDILRLIVEAEAEIHGVVAADVVLHEVGAMDSIADVVGAAYLIEAFSPASWSMSPLPVGGGFIQTDHGRLPVPAPATQLLLRGFPFVDDGISGERVTPTGAAILRYLEPSVGLPKGVFRSAETGHGFGTKTLPGVANALRARCYRAERGSPKGEQVAVLEFVIDDQTPEDLAVGLDLLRDAPGVLEVLQSAVVTKKGRMGHAIQLLTTPDSFEATAQACFEQTTTIGLRYRFEHRKVLPRKELTGSAGVSLKAVERPDGVVTVKAAMDDIGDNASGHHARELLRHQVEASTVGGDDHEER